MEISPLVGMVDGPASGRVRMHPVPCLIGPLLVALCRNASYPRIRWNEQWCKFECTTSLQQLPLKLGGMPNGT